MQFSHQLLVDGCNQGQAASATCWSPDGEGTWIRGAWCPFSSSSPVELVLEGRGVLVLKLLPLVLLRYRGHADGVGGPGGNRLKNLSRGGARGQPGGLVGDMLLRCAAVPDDRPGKQGPWVSRQRPLFLFLLLFSNPPDGSSNILFLGRRRSGRTSSCAGEASDVACGARPVGQLSVPCMVIPCARIWSGAFVRPPGQLLTGTQMGFTGLPPSLQGRLRASALPPPPPSATAATFLLNVQSFPYPPGPARIRRQRCCWGWELWGAGWPKPPSGFRRSDSVLIPSISLPSSMQVLDVLVLPTPIMGEQYPGQRQ